MSTDPCVRSWLRSIRYQTLDYDSLPPLNSAHMDWIQSLCPCIRWQQPQSHGIEDGIAVKVIQSAAIPLSALRNGERGGGQRKAEELVIRSGRERVQSWHRLQDFRLLRYATLCAVEPPLVAIQLPSIVGHYATVVHHPLTSLLLGCVHQSVVWEDVLGRDQVFFSGFFTSYARFNAMDFLKKSRKRFVVEYWYWSHFKDCSLDELVLEFHWSGERIS